MTIFIDGNVNHPKCRCTPDCEMPCWQLYGLTDEPCGACGCGGPEYQSAIRAGAEDPAKPKEGADQSASPS